MTSELIYDWNDVLKTKPLKKVELFDETLRDGLQSPSVLDPSIEDKKVLLNMMDDIGIDFANIGLPAASQRNYEDVLKLALYKKENNLNISLACAGRTLINDLEPIAKIQEQAGIPIIAYAFLGTSPVRQLVENWHVDFLLETTEKALSFAKKAGLKIAFVTEDTTRSHPDILEKLFKLALNLGAERLVLCDTVGHATPDGIKALVSFTKELIGKEMPSAKIDWHGHNDRGLGVSNALYAIEAGCDRIHGTALGVGERVGNTAIDQLILNLQLLKSYHKKTDKLVAYITHASKILRVPLSFNYPLAGSDAFRTATGVHASAVLKAQKISKEMSDIIYSAVPAGLFGLEQKIEIGPMSGLSNVNYWLIKHGLIKEADKAQKILDFAKTKQKVLLDDEITSFLKSTEERA